MTHQHRNNLTGEHRAGDLGQLVLYCLFMALWVADIFRGFSNFPNEYVPAAVQLPAGIIVLVISAYLAVTGIRIVFGRNAPEGIIRKGAFRFVRHPIYLSEILLYLALLILNISLAAAAVWIIAIGFLHYISRHEEKLLLERFGDDYTQYMREVPMWLPRLRKNR